MTKKQWCELSWNGKDRGKMDVPFLPTTMLMIKSYNTTEEKGDEEGVATPPDEVLWRSERSVEASRSRSIPWWEPLKPSLLVDPNCLLTEQLSGSDIQNGCLFAEGGGQSNSTNHSPLLCTGRRFTNQPTVERDWNMLSRALSTANAHIREKSSAWQGFEIGFMKW